jgi:hypothetical protein
MALKEVLEPQRALGIVMVRRKLFRTQCEEGTSVEEHIRQMQSFREELISLGQPVTKGEFAITLLTSLPESWNTFIGSIDTASLKSANTIISRILEYDHRLHTTSGDTALAGSSKSSKGNFDKSKVKCFKCGKMGHFKRDCKSKGKDGKNKNKDKDKGHVAEEGKGDYVFVAKEMLDGDKKIDIALAGILSDQWLGDTGCTSHVARE